MRPRCPHCQQRLRIAKGRCPACGALLDGLPAPEPEAYVRKDGSRTERIESAEKIRFKCPGCGKRVSIPVEQAGKTGHCPGCQEEITLPRIASGETDIGTRRGIDLEKAEGEDVSAAPVTVPALPETDSPDPPDSAGEEDPYERLRKLKALVDDGILTEEEFQRKKAAILDLL